MGLGAYIQAGLQVVANGFHATASMFEWAVKKFEAKNTTAMQANALSAADQAVMDQAAKALRERDLPTLRKLSS